MSTISKHALVPFRAMEMYELVNDIESYPEFLPWCTSAQVIVHESGRLRATVGLAKGAIKQQFTTENTVVPGKRIDMALVRGPFKRLTGTWHFQPLGEEGCRVSLDMEFEFGKGLVNLAFGRVFNEIANKLVDAFCERAKHLYRP